MAQAADTASASEAGSVSATTVAFGGEVVDLGDVLGGGEAVIARAQIELQVLGVVVAFAAAGKSRDAPSGPPE